MHRHLNGHILKKERVLHSSGSSCSTLFPFLKTSVEKSQTSTLEPPASGEVVNLDDCESPPQSPTKSDSCNILEGVNWDDDNIDFGTNSVEGKEANLSQPITAMRNREAELPFFQEKSNFSCRQERQDLTPVVSSKSMWKDDKYCRLERRRRALGRHIPGQTRLTAFFPILNEMELVLKSNRAVIQSLTARCEELSFNVSKDGSDSKSGLNLSLLLQTILETAKKNTGKNKHGHRFDLDIKLFATYIFLVGGRMVYEFLSANFCDSLPSLSMVEKTLSSASTPVQEGTFRFLELKQFLLSHNLPLKVWISEDGTRIVQKFCYNSSTNEIIGPVLPLSENGIPLTHSFPARSAAMIATHFENGTPSSSAYAILAQPVHDGSPPFCLSIFGTDNRFNSDHVRGRWTFISEELSKLEIEVLGFSSDGDAKLLNAMNKHMFTKSKGSVLKKDWEGWYFSQDSQTFSVMQDFIHTANKFRTRLNPSIILPFGNFTASQAHLRILIESVSKEEHGLCRFDLDKTDKMNFNASVKISSTRVTDLMMEKVPGSKGTVAYLTVMRYVIQSCLDESLSALERIYKIWYSVFFLRFWKVWLMQHPSYSMENFVTSNLFFCVEIIAHTLIKLVIRFRDSGTPELLLIHLFSSQPCESFFRAARSMTTTHSTVVNFTMEEFLAKIRRIDMLHYISTKMSDKLIFPREKRKQLLGLLTAEKLNTSYLPSDDEIFDVVMNAKQNAIFNLKTLGVSLNVDTALKTIKNYLMVYDNQLEVSSCEPIPRSYISSFTDEDIPLDILAAFPSPDEIISLDLAVRNITEPCIPEDSIFLFVPTSKGGFVRMRKSTFCWLLSSEGCELSSDRLYRVRGKIAASFGSVNREHLIRLGRSDEVEVGSRCVFKHNLKFLVGQVLGFSYLSGSGASRSYTLLKAPTEPPKEGAVRGLGCLCVWYSINEDKSLQQLSGIQHEYMDIKKYLATIPPPISTSQNAPLCLSQDTLNFLKTLI